MSDKSKPKPTLSGWREPDPDAPYELRMRLGTEEDLLRDFGSDGPFFGSPVRPEEEAET